MMDQTPRKYLMRDLLNKPTPTTVWLQGTIEQTVQNDILIISDSTGKAKITKCETADGIVDKATISKGTYCCIVGTAVKTKGLPEVQASKIVDLSTQPQMRAAWDMEVKDADLYLQGKTCPAVR
ncbi:hypothetical protein JYU34_014365 [Plutella xylostella]|uniref:Uncharacterized protein n=1 Tax=Plutella xylostella TaxID=51655 RepID=A0ABQ7QBT1_PLUXY|nr:hypothetical protein JYU34_014365 [Plutella xylostella]